MVEIIAKTMKKKSWKHLEVAFMLVDSNHTLALFRSKIPKIMTLLPR